METSNQDIFINENADDMTMINFLEDVVIKSKRLGHNKLQIQIEKYIQQIKTYENEIVTLNNNIDRLKKEKMIQVELNERQKSDLLNMTNNYNDLLSKYNELNISLSTERNTHNNIRLSYENQIQNTAKTQESLNIELLHQQNICNDIQKKFDDIKSRYDELTSLYSKQTFENNLLTRELNNAKDELNTTSMNNKKLYDELQNIKNELLNKQRDVTLSPSTPSSIQQVKPVTPVKKSTPVLRNRGVVAVNRK